MKGRRDKRHRKESVMLGGSLPAAPYEGDGEITSLRDLICSAVKLATHLNPDMDAILSVWLCQRVRKAAGLEPIEVLFIPANTQGIEDLILAVDVGKGRGIQRFGEGHSIKQSSLGGSAAMAIFRALPEFEQDVLRSLTKAVSYADEKGENIHAVNLKRGGNWGNIDIRNQIITTSMWTTHHALTHSLNDREILRWWTAVFNGMVEIGVRKKQGEAAAVVADYRLNGRLAVLSFGSPVTTSGFAFRNGAKVVLFSSSMGGDRWTLGLTRNPEPPGGPVDLNVVREVLEKSFPGIWVHPLGIMAGWASKAPLFCTRREFDERRERFIQIVTDRLRAVFSEDEK